MATFIGIDLGTTYSCIAQCDEAGMPSVIPCQAYSAGMATPSVITFMEDGKPIIGDEAKSYMTTPEYASRTLSFIKRYMGQDSCPEKIVIGGKGSTQKRNVSPVEGSACILHGLFNEAQKSVFGSQSLQGAVITIPAGYTEKQRACVKKAAQLAGINVLGLIHEPTAAAICHEIKSGETILVFDLGGGTLDVSIVTKKQDNYKVLAVSSDSEVLGHNLGGKDWDEALMNIACQKGGYKPVTEYEKGEMKVGAENCKKRLTRANEAQLFLPKNKGNVSITRSDFQLATKDLVSQCIKVVDECIAKADREASNERVMINRFIMVGGSSNMPMIKKALERKYGERFSNGRETERWLSVSNDAETSISKGAAIYARHLTKNPNTESEGVLIEERSIHSYGTSVGEDHRICNLIKSTDSMVFEKTFMFYTMIDNQKSVPVDLYENDSIEDVISWDGKDPIYKEEYCFDLRPPKGKKVEFKVNRDRDGLIRISVSSDYGHTQEFSHATSVISSSSSSVPSNGKQISHAVKNVISSQVEKQIIRSIELMQEDNSGYDDDILF